LGAGLVFCITVPGFVNFADGFCILRFSKIYPAISGVIVDKRNVLQIAIDEGKFLNARHIGVDPP